MVHESHAYVSETESHILGLAPVTFSRPSILTAAYTVSYSESYAERCSLRPASTKRWVGPSSRAIFIIQSSILYKSQIPLTHCKSARPRNMTMYKNVSSAHISKIQMFNHIHYLRIFLEGSKSGQKSPLILYHNFWDSFHVYPYHYFHDI